MPDITLLTTLEDYALLNQLKRNLNQFNIPHYPLLYQDHEEMVSLSFKQRLIQAQDLQAYLIKDSTHLIGYIIVEWVSTQQRGALKERQYAYIHDLGVNPLDRNQGIATQLMEHIESLMIHHKVEDIELAVHVDFEAAIHLYEKLGFTPRTLRYHKKINNHE